MELGLVLLGLGVERERGKKRFSQARTPIEQLHSVGLLFLYQFWDEILLMQADFLIEKGNDECRSELVTAYCQIKLINFPYQK